MWYVSASAPFDYCVEASNRNWTRINATTESPTETSLWLRKRENYHISMTNNEWCLKSELNGKRFHVCPTLYWLRSRNTIRTKTDFIYLCEIIPFHWTLKKYYYFGHCGLCVALKSIPKKFESMRWGFGFGWNFVSVTKRKTIFFHTEIIIKSFMKIS